MSDCSRILNPLHRDGTSQRQRLVKALQPFYAKIDERDAGTLLKYALDYAALLRYYTPGNEEEGDWTGFFENDVSMLAALAGSSRPEDWRERFAALRDAANAAPSGGRAAAFVALFGPLLEAARLLSDWRRRSVEGMAFQTALDRLFGDALNSAVSDAIACAKRTAQVYGADAVLDVSGLEGADAVGPDSTLLPGVMTDAAFSAAVTRVEQIFDRFQGALAEMARRAPWFFRETVEHYPRHVPHVALLLAFLGLFREAQRHLNTLTAAHLDFYYRDVLRLLPKPGMPDRVHLIFELAKGRTDCRIPKDTVLLAGKDDTQVPVYFATDSELLVNQASIDPAEGLKTLFLETAQQAGQTVVTQIYAARDADTADGCGAPLTDPDGRWPTFGSKDMPYAQVGFAIASPMFLLSEGTRTITVDLRLTSSAFLLGKTLADLKEELKKNVHVEASGQKAWIPLQTDSVDVAINDKDKGNFVCFTLRLGPEQPVVVPYNAAVLEGGYSTPYPVLRFIFDNKGLSAADLKVSKGREILDYSDEEAGYAPETIIRFGKKMYRARMPIPRPGYRPSGHTGLWSAVEPSYPYRYFQRMELKKVILGCEVTGVRHLILESDLGELDPAKPFQPWGPIPRSKTSFFVGSPEIFQKRLTELTLKGTWVNLPGTSFADYYSLYGETPANSSFKASVRVLAGGVWIPEKVEGRQLFNDEAKDVKGEAKNVKDVEDKDKTAAPDESFSLSLSASDFKEDTQGRDPGLEPFARYDSSLRRGFLRMDLDRDFLHGKYAPAVATAAKGDGPVPPPPYTPMLTDFSADYKAEETVDFSAPKSSGVERVFHIGPFGHRQIWPVSDDPAVSKAAAVRLRLAPEFTAGAAQSTAAEGTLFIGLARLKPPQNLSLLFQVAEGSEDLRAPSTPTVIWSHLDGDNWVDFLRSEILSDGTNGLLQSGIVQLAMPATMTSTNTSMPAGLHWIRASVADRSAAIPQLVAIHTQAAVASFRDQGNDPRRLAAPLAPGVISKLQVRDAGIKSVQQPYASFGGRTPESAQPFRIRTSERLRHKHRAVSIFDYERIVLEEFPEVYKVKCVNHTSADSEFAPGCVRVAVIPNLRNRNAVDPFHPMLSRGRLTLVQQRLEELSSGFLKGRIEVVNPDYEDIRVRFQVRFQPGADDGYYLKQLNRDIVQFLSPWLYDDAADLSFGGSIHRSAILDWVEEREYVDFVTDFAMDQITAGGQVLADVEEARATTSSAALVSAREHVIGDNIVSCEDAAPAPAPPEQGDDEPGPVPPDFPRYLGNVRHMEMHDLARRSPNCQIDEILEKDCFPDIETGLRLGYDYCAWCFGRTLSKR